MTPGDRAFGNRRAQRGHHRVVVDAIFSAQPRRRRIRWASRRSRSASGAVLVGAQSLDDPAELLDESRKEICR
ncbi:MAG: hypothetical protein R6X23_15160, partial [Acidimicrobiia bacterium]